mmetsp:Transcript_37815/g.68353  ORF Transcript_37815/g.68353 Transcript_37815/m.68353 type:complete len:95 (-) Transcript_37815:670-954(-)
MCCSNQELMFPIVAHESIISIGSSAMKLPSTTESSFFQVPCIQEATLEKHEQQLTVCSYVKPLDAAVILGSQGLAAPGAPHAVQVTRAKARGNI